jgi:hypothetical protein
LFLTDEPKRSILLRLTDTNLLEAVLQCLEKEMDVESDFIALHLLRFLCQWIYEAPVVVQALLSNQHAVVLSLLFGASNRKRPKVQALAQLLLGLCMESMGDESQCGGWTVQGIMDMISTTGVGKFTAALERLKTDTDLPWSQCQLEWNLWSQWCASTVLTVRKRVVQELTATTGDNGEVDEDGTSDAGSSARKDLKSLQKLVAEQSNELDELRTSLSEAQRTVASQGTFMRRLSCERSTTTISLTLPLCRLNCEQKSNWLRGRCEWKVHRRSWTKC